MTARAAQLARVAWTKQQLKAPAYYIVRTNFKNVRLEITTKYRWRPPPKKQPAIASSARHSKAVRQAKATPVATAAARVRSRLRLPEFWLGLSGGLGTRLLFKLVLSSTLRSANPNIATGFLNVIACAVAGLAAGAAVHWIKLACRNRRTLPAQREHYWTKAVWESAVTGLLGGILGGCVADIGALVVRAGNLAVSMAAGAAMGAPYALTMETRAQSASRWRAAALQGAVFGAIGGALGIVSVDLFGAHSPAMVAEQASRDVPLPHLATVAAAAPPLSALPPVSQLVQKPGFAQMDSHSHPHAPLKLAMAHHVPPRAESFVELTFQPNQPMAMAAATYHAPPPVDHSPLPPPAIDPDRPALKGPCAEPGVVCIERVVFDDDGNATKAVLDVAPDHHIGAHFAMETKSSTTADSWNTAAQDTTATPGPDATVRVSLIVPFTPHAAAQAPGSALAPA